jgi:hypothetical protein
MCSTHQQPAYSASDLATVLGQLPAKDLEFAQSLIKNATRYGASPNQAKWIDVLTRRAKGETYQPHQRPQVQVGDLGKVIALFDKAREHLAYPKVLLRVGDRVVKLSVAGEKAKVPGSLNVASEGRYGEAIWYGRITRDGKFAPSKDGQAFQGLAEALQAFAKDPAGVAAEYGRWRGACCFCARQLDDERSTAVGYGPTCADNFGLPWGK